MKPDQDSLWGIYLVDRFDNAVLLHESEGEGYFEPMAYKPRKAPPVIPSMIQPESDTATLFIQDIYEGPGLKDVPRGTVKYLRIGSYQPNVWGLYDMHGNVGEWTASSYRAYPFKDESVSLDDNPQIERFVRGGSYRDRPHRASSSHRLMYRAWQKVHDVGFRVVVEN